MSKVCQKQEWYTGRLLHSVGCENLIEFVCVKDLEH